MCPGSNVWPVTDSWRSAVIRLLDIDSVSVRVTGRLPRREFLQRVRCSLSRSELCLANNTASFIAGPALENLGELPVLLEKGCHRQIGGSRLGSQTDCDWGISIAC